MNRGRGGFGFPSWNYGYTLGPQDANGGFSEFFRPQFPGPYGPPGYDARGFGGFGPRFGGPHFRRPPRPPPPKVEKEVEGDEKEVSGLEDGQIVERPLSEILQGRHPIVFCNEQSKIRRLPIEWEQVSETGPPHDKTFTWSLKMGEDLVTVGVANNKKGAKSKAAEEMAKKLDVMPGMRRKRPFVGHAIQHHFPTKKRKPEKPEAPRSAEQSALDKKSQNNPISKLYEHCRQNHWQEPLFETVSENVLETRKNAKGFTMKKTEFTVECQVQGKKFSGTALTKKEAKYNAAAGAWAEFGVGVSKDSISDLLQTQRDAVNPPSSSSTS